MTNNEHQVGTRVLIIHATMPGMIGRCAIILSKACECYCVVNRKIYRAQFIEIDGLGAIGETGEGFAGPPEWMIPMPDSDQFVGEEAEQEVTQ